jgi:putative oligomerization/nucleic acid binding protein/phospholipase D-like protein
MEEIPVIAGSYPFADAIWTMLIFFVWILWFWMLFTVFGDLFSRHDIGGWAKAGWSIFVIILPFLGVFIYLIAEGKGMGERAQARAQGAQQEADAYIRSVASTSGPTDEIARGKELLDSGAITQAEYDQLKAKALGAS